MATPTEKSVIDGLRALAQGLETYLPNESFFYASESHTGAEVIAEVRSLLANGTALLSARAALKDAARDFQEACVDKAPFLAARREMLQLAYSNDTGKLAEFGLAPLRHRAPPTTEEILLRNAKALSTRKERRTMGKRQRAAIKGNVTGVTITPVTKGK